MNLEFFIALKYLRSKKHNKFISIIAGISIFGIAIGVMALITVLSVMNGFQDTIREKIINTGFHIYITSYGKESIVENYEDIIKIIKEAGIGEVITPFFKGQVIIKSTEQRIMGIDFFGIDKYLNKKDKEFRNSVKIVKGDFDLSRPYYILIGNELANFLDVKVGDGVDIISPQGGKYKISGRIAPVMKRYIVKGIFKTGYYDYDLKLAFTSLESLQILFNKPKKAWGIGIKIKEIFSAPQIAIKLRKILNYQFQIFTWKELNYNLFTALKNEKSMMGFIVFLIIVVASFNIASTLIMLMMEKKKEIAILKAMGASSKQITNIFLLNGVMTGSLGILIGLFSGIILSLNLEKVFSFIENVVNFILKIYFNIFSKFLSISYPGKFEILAKDVYYLESLPIKIMASDIISICIGAVLVIFIFSYFPAKQTTKFKPMEIIRNE